ncbi:MAG TPA: universal stress protein [Gammaproteobacteria bacterium]|nr:universal stress protein [Gammaproteobacteria bacterium]
MSGYSHILAPVDFSQATRPILKKALMESELHSARLSLLHVIEFYPEDVPPGLVPPENIDPGEVYLRRARDYLAVLAREIGVPDVERIALSCTGSAYHEIIRFAKDNDVNLIVMGYTGRWLPDVLGSTAMAVTRHSQCDVLLVRNTQSTA